MHIDRDFYGSSALSSGRPKPFHGISMMSHVILMTMYDESSSLGHWDAEDIEGSNDGVRSLISSISMARLSDPTSKSDGSSTSVTKVLMALKHCFYGNCHHLLELTRSCLSNSCRHRYKTSVVSRAASICMLVSRNKSASDMLPVSQWQAWSFQHVWSIVGACQLLRCT
jgi:hypothetical protein